MGSSDGHLTAALLRAGSVAALACCLACPAAAEIPAAGVPVRGKVSADHEALAKARALLLPVSGAYELGRLRLEGLGAAEPADEAESDAQGLFLLSAPEPGMWKVRLEAKGRVPREYVLAPLLEAVDLPAVDLEPAAELVVRLTGPGNRPLAGRVSVFAGEAAARRSLPPPGVWASPHLVVTAGETGTVRVPVSAGERTWVVEAAAAGRLAVRREVPGPRILGRVDLVLRPGPRREIAVVDERGRPLPGTWISEAHGSLPLALAGDDGRAALVVGRGTPAFLFLAPGGRRGFRRLAPEPAEDEVETVRLAAPRTFSGRVVDRGSRRPIAGALVWRRAAGPGEHVRTGSGGGYELPLREPRGGDVLLAAAVGYSQGSVSVRLDSSTAGPTVALSPAASLSGVVADGAGRPLAAVEVEAVRTLGGRRSFAAGLPANLYALSGEEGRFHLPGLPAGEAYELHFQKDGFAPARLALPDLEPFEARTGLRVVLHEGRGGRGRVVDESDAAVAGAEVWLTESARRSRFSFLEEEDPAHRSDAEGWFEVPDLAAGRYDLAAAAPGFATARVPGIEIPEGEGKVDLGVVVLVPGAAIEGRVVDPAGSPVAEAEVRVTAGGASSSWRQLLEEDTPAQATSGAGGGFVVTDQVPGERLDLRVDKVGFVRAYAAGVVAPAAEPVVVVLWPASRILGRVVEDGGGPVSGARVEVLPEGQGGSGGAARRFARQQLATSDEEGSFAVEGVAPGGVTISVRAVGFESFELSGQKVPAGGVLDGLELVLRRGATLSGRILDAGGAPAVAVAVGMSEPGARAGSPSRASAVTDGDGRYEIVGLGLGLRTVAAEHDGAFASKSVEIEAGDNTADLVLEPGAELSGRVVDPQGAGVEGAGVFLSATSGNRRTWPATAGAGGRFTLRGIRPGTYRLVAAGEGFASSGSAEIEVAGATVAGLELRLRTGAVLEGRVLGLGYDDLVKVVVRVPARAASTRTDYEGRYSIPDLAPGEITVRAEVPGTGRQVEERITIAEEVPVVSLDLEFGSGYVLTGVAVRGAEPVVGADVVLRAAGGARSARTSTDRGGAFRFEGLTEGSYQLQLYSSSSGLRHEEGVEVSGDGHVVVEVATGGVAGRIRDRDDLAPVAGAVLTLASGGRQTRRARSDSRGYFSLGEVGEGSWKLVAGKPGYADLEVAVDVRAGAAEELDLELRPASRLTLKVALPSGQPPSVVRIAAFDGGGQRLGGGAHRTSDGGRVSVTTLPPGSWELLIAADESATMSVRATVPGELGLVRLPPGGSLWVAVDELHGAAATLRLVGPDGRPHREVRSDGLVSSQWPLPGGGATLSNLAPGPWTVEVTAADGRLFRATAVVEPGTTAQVTLPREP